MDDHPELIVFRFKASWVLSDGNKSLVLSVVLWMNHRKNRSGKEIDLRHLEIWAGDVNAGILCPELESSARGKFIARFRFIPFRSPSLLGFRVHVDNAEIRGLLLGAHSHLFLFADITCDLELLVLILKDWRIGLHSVLGKVRNR